jgi:hypothetical protein
MWLTIDVSHMATTLTLGGVLIAPPPAPPVRELPDAFKNVVESEKFPALARWIDCSVAFASLYFAGSNNTSQCAALCR